ncbi:MNNG and nitrosoguanidine resistance protein [Xylariaceae sp. FL0804]|nr:MNNG and nitrosoguanidine resistance protein [Xylariaceae sp. FL0804]
MSNRGRNPTPDASGFLVAARNDSGTADKHSSNNTSASGGGGGGASGSHYDDGDDDDDDSRGPHDYDQAAEEGYYGGGGGARDGKHIAKPHQSVGFWHPEMSKVRRHVLLLWVRTILIIMVFVLSVLSLYWAVLFSVEKNMSALTVHVVDFDGQVAPYDDVVPFVGPLVTQVTEELATSSQPTLGYKTVPAARYGGDPLAARRDVYDDRAWACVVVNPNATALLEQAALTGNASYDPTGALQFVLQTARQESTYYDYVLPQLSTLERRLAQRFGAAWASRLMGNDTYDRQTLARAPAAVNPGIAPLQVDLRPFQPATATPAVSIGLIYLIIVAFFSFSFFLPIHSKYITPQGHPPLHFWQLILWRWIATVVAYVLISLTYSLVSLAFQIPFWPEAASHVHAVTGAGATKFGRASFVVYWMLNFVGMTALGLACENVAMVVGQPWTALWLIFWVITNVSTAFYSLQLAPAFFQWGYAWPLHNIVQGSRTIVFDLRSELGLNFGVLFAWAAVNTLLFPFCCYFMRWKMEHQQRKAEKDKDRYVVNTDEGEKEFRKREGENPPIRKRGFFRGV